MKDEARAFLLWSAALMECMCGLDTCGMVFAEEGGEEEWKDDLNDSKRAKRERATAVDNFEVDMKGVGECADVDALRISLDCR